MHPNLFPQRGTPISGLSHAMSIMRDIAQQAATNANLNVGDGLIGDTGWSGVHVGAELQPQWQCFEIRSNWRQTNPYPNAGPSEGIFWACDAKPVVFATPNARTSFWDCCNGCDSQQIFWAMGVQWSELTSLSSSSGSSSGGADASWQSVLFPVFCIGQWVWCIFDYVANVWRVLDAYDSIVRFELTEPLVSCQLTAAKVLGFVPPETSSSSSSSSVEAPPVSDSSSSSSASSSSEAAETTCWPSIDRGAIQVIDLLNIVTGTLPTGTRGWAKRMADSNCFEIMWTGASASSDLVECCLMEDHPGRGTQFEIRVAEWDSDQGRWIYENDGLGNNPEDQTICSTPHYGIDWRYGMTYYPLAGAKGLFTRRLYTGTSGQAAGDGYIYECVSLDCDSPGLCCGGWNM